MRKSSQALIRLDNCRRTYHMGGRDIHALDGVSVNIHANEFVAIIGKSGSGKTTLMNIIGGLDHADEGDVFINNQDISALGSKALAKFRNESIGFVFQQFNLLSHHTALGNVMLPLSYRRPKVSNAAELSKLALERVGLADRMDHKPEELSGGQQQRVAIARALVGEPDILLADEPTGALDTKTSEDLLALFNELREGGLTVLLITHDLDVANHAQRRISLRDGKIINDSSINGASQVRL